MQSLRPFSGVALSPDGKRLAKASLDCTVQVCALDLRELLNLARSRITSTLTAFTEEECQSYFQSRDVRALALIPIAVNNNSEVVLKRSCEE